LHNLFHFLRLRMDKNAQYEIRVYAETMAEIVRQVVPIAWEAFEDYILNGEHFSKTELQILSNHINAKEISKNYLLGKGFENLEADEFLDKIEKLAGQ
jgi:thymidylate synthase (FAD)